MSKLFGLNKPNTNLRKNVFDLSERSLFSCSAGQLLPVFTRECNPSEKFEINLSSLVRTQPLNTAAFVRCRQYYHVFFIPFRQLWNGWDNFINGVNYKTSSLQKDKSYTDKLPSFKFKEYIGKMVTQNVFLGSNYKGESYEDFIPATPIFNDSDDRVNDYERDAFERDVQKYVSNPFLTRVQSYDDYKRICLDEHGYRYVDGVSRLFDLLGYGFIYNGSNSVSSFVDKYCSDFGSGSDDIDRTIDRLSAVSLNPFRFLAYQKIYNDFYKRDDYEASDPTAWNIDDFSSLSDLGSCSPERLLSMTRLRYRWSPKDYFSGIVPNELYNTTALESFSSNYGSDGADEINVTSRSVNYKDGAVSFSTRGIRFAFALEKLFRLSRRAGGYDYINQISAHYGFNVPEGRGDKVKFLGGFSTSIDINEVVTTSSFAGDVEGNPVANGVGQIFGKGVGVVDPNKPITFTAPEHGLIMCISSVVPELDYNGVGLDRFNTKLSRGDYFHPELQDLGLQPVFGYELANDMSDKPKNGRKGSALLGYVPAYSEYKTAYDKLHGEFRAGRSLSAWSGSNLLDYDSSGVIISSLKINPACLDRIFSVNFNGKENTDQFIVSSQFMCKAIRPMSVTGQNL